MLINLLDPAGYADGAPYDQFAWLRANAPVYWHESWNGVPGFWAVTRYADARVMLSDPATFSSMPTSSMDDGAALTNDDVHLKLIFSDPPKHTDHRKFLSPLLSPGVVKKLAEAQGALVTQIIDDVIERGECDLVEDMAGKLASYTIADLLGLPRNEIVDLYAATDRMLNSHDRGSGEGLKAVTEIMSYIKSVWESRTAQPRDDFVSRLADGFFCGRKVDLHQFSLDLQVLIAAGGDTTRNAFSGGMLALFNNPDQLAALRADPALAPKAVEEMLRWVSPIVYQRRTATCDTEFGGKKISTGERVIAWAGSSNRDPEVFENPESFNIHRWPNAHMTFGYGNHHCLGAHLARLELTTMLVEVMRRMPDLHQTGIARWLRDGETLNPTIVGPKTLPVGFTPGRITTRQLLEA